MNTSESIIVGIISGVIVSTVVVLASMITRKIILPTYRELIYRGIIIKGEWLTEVTNPSGNFQNMIMMLEQKAEKIKGTITVTKRLNKSNKTEIKNYSISGEIRDRFVTMQGRNSNPSNLGVHVELLEVIGDGNIMKGISSWYSITNKLIQSDNIEWTRNS